MPVFLHIRNTIIDYYKLYIRFFKCNHKSPGTMTKEEFIIQARNQIPGNPEDRVSDKAKTMLEKDDTLFDIHCHIFDKDSVAKNYFLLRILDKLDSNGKLDDLVDFIVKRTDDNEIDELFNIMNCDSMMEVLNHYLDNFAWDREKILPTPLMMDLDEGWYFNPKKDVQDRIDEIKLIMKEKPILPFLAIDPRKADKTGRDNLYRLFLNAFTGDEKFFGVKVYPALGYLPSHPDLMPIFRICEEKRIPVTTHAGGTIIRTYENDIVLQGFQVLNNEVVSYMYTLTARGQDKAKFLNNPALWEAVLKKFPNLKLNLGHFGGTNEWEAYPSNTSQQRINTIKRFMNEYPNLYADYSFNLTYPEYNHTFFEALNTNPVFKERSMFGTDYWMVIPMGNFKRNQQLFIDEAKNQHLDKLLMQDNPRKFLFA